MKRSFIVLVLALQMMAQDAPKAINIPRPDPKNYSTGEAYEDALIDWKLQQADSKKMAAAPACATLAKCRVALKEAMALNESLKARMAQEAVDGAKHEADIQAQLAQARKAKDDAEIIMEALYYHQQGKPIPQDKAARIVEMAGSKEKSYQFGQVLAMGQNAIADYVVKLAQHDKEATDKYNSLLADYKVYAAKVDAALSRQQRINNALALYGLMPKYTPPQAINLQVTNCNQFPALCVH